MAVAANQFIWRTAMDQARHAVCQNVTVVAVTLNIQRAVAK
jgi:hypothetical protein